MQRWQVFLEILIKNLAHQSKPAVYSWASLLNDAEKLFSPINAYAGCELVLPKSNTCARAAYQRRAQD